jgi:hypothetical protein
MFTTPKRSGRYGFIEKVLSKLKYFRFCRFLSTFRANFHGFLPLRYMYCMYCKYVTKRTQSKVVGALRAPINNILSYITAKIRIGYSILYLYLYLYLYLSYTFKKFTPSFLKKEKLLSLFYTMIM